MFAVFLPFYAVGQGEMMKFWRGKKIALKSSPRKGEKSSRKCNYLRIFLVVLGHYNAFDGVVLHWNDVTVDMGKMYGAFAELTSVHPFAYALLMENVIYVDISEA
jgi:hypothetical protein